MIETKGESVWDFDEAILADILYNMFTYNIYAEWDRKT